MAMQRKASSTRKPPEPSESHAEIDDWMRRVMPDLNPIVTRLDELIRERHSDLQFAVKWKKAYYGLPDVGWMMEMVAYDVSVNVVFFGGADFDTPPPLGDADRSRHQVEDDGRGRPTRADVVDRACWPRAGVDGIAPSARRC